ncbi:MAG: hypothetical protein RI947_1297 [Candidatus Parcubacteria bacterium]|jgi:ferredoxin-NADP reductase
MISTYHTHLLSKKQLTDDVYIFTFAADPLEPLQFVAGQYLILHVPQAGADTARRLYSIVSAAYEPSTFDLIVQVFPNGVASQYLLNITEKDTVLFQGPAGIFTLKNTPHDMVFFATGTGYAPMHSMIHDLFKNNFPGTIHLYWGFSTLKDVYYYEILTQMAADHPNFKFHICLTREANMPDLKYFARGRITAVWENTLYAKSNEAIYDYYICSGRETVESLKQYLLSKGISKEYIHSEKF